MKAARGRILLASNSAWTIANFRGGLIRALLAAGYEVVAAAHPDEHVARIEAWGIRFVPVTMDLKGTNPLRDLAPISLLASFPLALVVGKTAPFDSLPALLDFARANPQRANYGASAASFQLPPMPASAWPLSIFQVADVEAP